MKLLIQECKQNKKSFLIWAICLLLINVGCILLYKTLEDSIQGIAETYSNMGAMSAAIGMDKLNLATVEGYYGSEIAMMFNLGGALYAALLGIGLLSKEESGHTAEFLHTLPISRTAIYLWKYVASFLLIIVFNLINIAGNLLSLNYVGDFTMSHVLLYHVAAFLMQIEIMTITFCISAFNKQIQTGAGLGLAILFFAADMMSRILPDLEKCKYITPFYYCSAADIFTEGKLDPVLLSIGMCITVLCLIIGGIQYNRKDLSA
ncbi:MAG: ABC transporter permease [Acetatifactor sp.]|nr:ABC transporter permease [Acetatifactor sp.]